MAVDLGTGVGRIDLDVSGVTRGAQQATEAFDSITDSADNSFEGLSNYAKSLENVLSGAYKELAKTSEQVAAAQQTYQTVLEQSQAKVATFAAAVESAEKQQQAAQQKTAQAQADLTAAQEQSSAALEKYIELRSKEKVNQAILEAANQKLQRDLQVEEACRQRLAQAMADEQEAAKKVQSAKQQQADAIVQAARDQQTAQANIAKAEEQYATLLAQNASKQLAAINSVTNASSQSASNRQRNARETSEVEQQANREAEESARKAADQQALAFAVAAKAVDTVVEALKTAISKTIEWSKEIVNTGAEFETAMAQVAATSKMSAGDVDRNIQDYQDLTNAAKEAGLTTMFSASEAAEALNYLALAGYSVEDSIKYMPESLTLAAAGAMDLGRASDMVTDAISALGLDISETSMFIDKMATTAQSSNTNIQQLGSAILTIGGTAQVLAGGVTELDTALGILANNGIKANQGGTALRQILINLTKPTKQASEIIDELGLNIYDAEGNMRGLNEIFGDLNEIMKDFSDKERMDVITHLFDARQLRAANALMKDSGEAWDNLQQKIEESEGSAEKMAETMRSNLNGALNIAKSNLDSISITLYEGIHKNITDLVNEAIPKLKELNSTLASPEIQSRLETMSADIKEIALRLLDIAIDAAPKIISAISNIKANLQTLGIAIGTILAFKLATHIGDVLKALVSLATFVAANPLAAVAVAVAAVVAAIIQLRAEAEQTHNALVSQIQAQNDKYSEQRKNVESLVEEWDSFKETSQEVKEEAQDQADKVQGLYEEYKKLSQSGEDTTLALQALADEIPELNDLLADGKTSFEDITTAVDEYCESLIRAAEIEGAKDTYVQAVKTRNALGRSLDEQKQAMIESGEAADKARQEYEAYNKAYDYHISQVGGKAAKAERERLKANAEALGDIYAQNIATYSEATQAYAEADKAAEDSRADFNLALKQDLQAEGQVFEDKATADKEIAKQQAKAMSEGYKAAEEEAKAAMSEYYDGVLAEWDGYDKKIELRQMTTDKKWELIGDWFKANPDWDTDNEDLRKQYDKYCTYIEKGEAEIAEAEKKAEEDRLKEEETTRKNAEKARQQAVSDAFSEVKDNKTIEGWSDEEYITALEKHLNDNLAYYNQYADKKRAVDKEIATAKKTYETNKAKEEKAALKALVDDDKDRIEYEKDLYNWSESEYNAALKEHLENYKDYYEEYADERTKLQRDISIRDAEIERDTKEAATKEAESYFDTWSEGYEDLIDNAKKAYQSLEKERASFQNNLLKSVELYGTKTEKVWDKTTHKYKDQKTTGITTAKELQEQFKAIENFDKTMDSLKAKGVSDDLLSEIWGMDTEKAMEFSKTLNQMSTSELKAYSNTYQSIVDKTTQMSDKYYQTQIQDFNEKYITPLSEYVTKHGEELKTHMGNIGKDTILGWITGLESEENQSEGAVKDIMDSAITIAKNALGIASPSKQFYEIGEYTIQGFLNGIQSKIAEFANIFVSLGQTAGESFVQSFKTYWDSFINMLNTTGGLTLPVSMTTSMFGTPTSNGSQIVYSNSTYTGLTKADVVSAIKEAVPDGDVILTVDAAQFGRVSRSSLNLLAQQGGLGLQV